MLGAVIAHVLWQLAYRMQFVESRYTAINIVDGPGLYLGQKTRFFGGKGGEGVPAVSPSRCSKLPQIGQDSFCPLPFHSTIQH